MVGRPLRWSAVGLGRLAVTITVVISVLRSGTGAMDTIWAEDGAVFRTDAANLGLADTVLTCAGPDARATGCHATGFFP